MIIGTEVVVEDYVNVTIVTIRIIHLIIDGRSMENQTGFRL